MKRKALICSVAYLMALVIFTVYIALDTFVLKNVYTVVDDSANEYTSKDTNTEPLKDPQITDTSYDDGNITINITTYRENETNIYVADVVLSSSDYLKTAFANSSYGKNVTAKTSETASDVGAILAINGDYYGARENGYVIRNGVLYRDDVNSDTQDLVISNDGIFSIINESETDAESLLDNGARQVLSFGPALVNDGEVVVDPSSKVAKETSSNPRTAIGMIDENHYVLIVSDGRTDESEGLSLYEMATFMENLGVTVGYNLDGGGSSTMYFNGEIVNYPTTNGDLHERSVSDIVYIGY